MPLGAALPKITATRDHGAEVELYGVTVDEALAEAKRYAEETGAVFVHPFDNEDIIAGQGTIGLEILEQVPDVDTVIVGAAACWPACPRRFARRSRSSARRSRLSVFRLSTPRPTRCPSLRMLWCP